MKLSFELSNSSTSLWSKKLSDLLLNLIGENTTYHTNSHWFIERSKQPWKQQIVFLFPIWEFLIHSSFSSIYIKGIHWRNAIFVQMILQFVTFDCGNCFLLLESEVVIAEFEQDRIGKRVRCEWWRKRGRRSWRWWRGRWWSRHWSSGRSFKN